MIKLPRKKKKAFKKWLAKVKHITLKPNTTATPDEIVESLYHFWRTRHQAKLIFTTKGE